MSEELKAALARIACLEGEIAKRDARIMGLESQYQRDVWGLNNEGDPIGGEPAGGYANDNARLRAELAALKAQDTVGEVVGWYRLDRPYEMTPYPSVCATWHKLGAPVAPLYAAHAQQVSVPDGWRELAKRADDFLYSLPETDGVLRLRADLCSMLAAAPAAPAADAGIVDMYRHLQKVTPYRFKKIQDASITDGGDVMYFHKDRFDAALLADMAAHCAAKGVV